MNLDWFGRNPLTAGSGYGGSVTPRRQGFHESRGGLRSKSMRTPLNRTFGWFMVLIAIAIVNPKLAGAQGILRDLFRAANRGALTEPTRLNVPGKTVRIKVGQVETAAWAGVPQP